MYLSSNDLPGMTRRRQLIRRMPLLAAALLIGGLQPGLSAAQTTLQGRLWACTGNGLPELSVTAIDSFFAYSQYFIYLRDTQGLTEVQVMDMGGRCVIQR